MNAPRSALWDGSVRRATSPATWRATWAWSSAADPNRRPSSGWSSASRSKRSAGSGTSSATTASSSARPSAAAKRSANTSHGDVDPLGVGVEQLVVRGPADLLEQHRQDVAVELDRLVAGQQGLDAGVVEEAGELGRRPLQPVVELGPVRHAAPGPDVEHGFAPARLVPQRAVGALDEASAAALGDEDQQVGERLAEADGDDVGAGLQPAQVELGGVPGGEEHEPVLGGERGDGLVAASGLGVEVAHRQHHDVGHAAARRRRRASPTGVRRARRAGRRRGCRGRRPRQPGGSAASTRRWYHSR